MKMYLRSFIGIWFLGCLLYVNAFSADEDEANDEMVVMKRKIVAGEGGCIKGDNGALICGGKAGSVGEGGVSGGQAGCIRGANGFLVCGGKGGGIGEGGAVGGKGGCIRFRKGGRLFCGGGVGGIGVDKKDSV